MGEESHRTYVELTVCDLQATLNMIHVKLSDVIDALTTNHKQFTEIRILRTD